ncbi:PREDICTED: U-box domain-containing protein 33-like isoform X1 [Camelina sativa]|uniref:RING-type E3 ubiquitin transferase n=1 Tax=Camelina sativa TaxID=90675 RepID=A0ABM0YYX0_CAMSA|nr:PREDICTED: U-box domain-containing protein 33-like isoform X1 [Camelina sativa]
MEETVSSGILEEKIFVAVGKNVWKNTSNLLWALENSEGNRICILHIHQPSPTIPVLGTRFEASTADEELVRAYRGKETVKTDKILQEYLSICLKKGVQAEKLCFAMDSIEKGILEMIQQHKIRKLVMGAAADKHYSMKMEDLRSKKASFVCEQAPATCQIQFTCKGNLIHTRFGEDLFVFTEISTTAGCCFLLMFPDQCREARMDEVRALSALLSEFQRLGLPQISTNTLQEVASLDGQNDKGSSSSCQSAGTLSHPGRSEDSINEVQEEPNDSSSQVFPCSGMGLNMINFLINYTKLWQKLTVQNHEHRE